MKANSSSKGTTSEEIWPKTFLQVLGHFGILLTFSNSKSISSSISSSGLRTFFSEDKKLKDYLLGRPVGKPFLSFTQRVKHLRTCLNSRLKNYKEEKKNKAVAMWLALSP